MGASLFSFFSGVGMLDLAFERCGYEVVLVNEFEERFLDAYKYVRDSLGMVPPRYGYYLNSADYFSKRRGRNRLLHFIDIERTNGNLVGFIGGPPCPDFSVAGKNMGSKGKHGRLTKTYFDIICRTKPDFFVFENVKGLVRTQKHLNFYKEMQIKLGKNGYIISHSLLNALEYGVPQFREREIMIGISSYLAAQLNITSHNGVFDFPWKEYTIDTIDNILSADWPTHQRFLTNSKRKNKWPQFEELSVEYWFRRNDVYHHPNTYDRFNVKDGLTKMMTIDEGDSSRKSFKRLHRWRYSPTACYGNNEVHLHPYKPRRLSVSEAMAIQSLPREFVLPHNMTLSLKFKTIGNGVPYKLAEAVARSLKEFLRIEEE